MKTTDAIRWFKTTFHAQLGNATSGTPFTVDLLCAIAYQETGYIWSRLLDDGMALNNVLKLCVGDTIDAKYKNGKNVGRSAFPKNKAELMAYPQGDAMFPIARQCLVEMAKHIPGYQGAAANSSKFCRGFGIFQYDLQFFKKDTDYFLQKKWESFDDCLSKAVHELHSALSRQGWSAKTSLDHNEQVHTAIAYNRGKSILSKGFKQGHFNGARYYGENIHEYLLIANGIQVAGTDVLPQPGEAPISSPEKPVQGKIYRVDVSSALMLRSGPSKTAAILHRLPACQLVTRIDGSSAAKWFQVETSVNGALKSGFAFAEYLKPVPKTQADHVPVIIPLNAPVSGLQAVYCPRQPGTVTKRVDPAGARSLNESAQPVRSGETAADRVKELAKIIEWLNVGSSSHKRYWPASNKTYCNIYAHDYCHLAGVYLPRVWWTGQALLKIGRGETVEPLIGNTIDEQRANDLFRWLKGFGPQFGWRETAALNELQDTANLGGVCLIIARRKEDGKSGHVVMVVPETDTHKASRNSAGGVLSPLQSQAGSTNFNYGRGTKEWWKHDRFADHAFWIHG
jgi:hypothetical protein